MVAKLIDGRTISGEVRRDISKKVANYKQERGCSPALTVILVGDNPASHVYVTNKRKACEQVGIKSDVILMPADTSEDEIIEKLQTLNADPQVHGILIQLPLPPNVDTSQVIAHLAPQKDVDGLHPQNLGLLFAGHPHLIPCTPLGCLHLIRSVMSSVEGKRAVVVGRSLLVGRPTALLLGFQSATVVQTHSHTVNLAKECRQADILVTAVGKPGLITAEYVKPGAVVIDVGITRVLDSKGTSYLKGDVAFEEVREIAGYLTPVPGGVGPMTVTYLLLNTLSAAQRL